MADNDDINKKSKPINRSGGGGDDPLFERIVGRGKQRALRQTLKETELSRKISENEELVNTLTEGLESGLGSPQDKKGGELLDKILTTLNRASRDIERDRPRLASRQASRLERQSVLMESSMRRLFSESSIRGQVGELSRGTEAINGSSQMMQTPFEELELRKESLNVKLNRLGEGAAHLAPLLISDPSNQARTAAREKNLKNIFAERQNVLGELAKIEVAQRQQRELGLDPKSKLSSLYKAASHAESIIGREDIASQYSSDKIQIQRYNEQTQKTETQTIKRAEIEKSIVEQSKDLLNAMKELANAAEGTAEKIAAEKKALTAKENIEKLEQAESLGRDQGRPTSGPMQRAQNAMNAGTILSGFAQGIDQLFVGQRMRVMANQAGLAAEENEKYDTYRKALAGDVMSMDMLTQFGASENFGGQMYAGKQVAKGASVAANAAEAFAGGTIMAASTESSVPGAVTGTLGQNVMSGSQGFGMLVSGTTNTIVDSVDIAKEISATEAKLAGRQLNMETRRTVNYVPAFQKQQLVNYGTSMRGAAMGLGSGPEAESFLNRTLNDNAFLQRMQDARVSPEEMGQMLSYGVNEIGSTFNEESAFTARGLEKSGLGSRQENLQRMGMLAQAGANNPQTALSNVLEAAIGRGFDNSKSVGVLVKNTAEMASQSGAAIAAGMDVSGAIATTLAAGALSKEQMPNREFALERSRQVQEVLAQAATDTSTSVLGLINTSNISAKTGLSSRAANFAAQLSPVELKELEGMNDDQAKAFLRNRGIPVTEFKGDLRAGIQGLMRGQVERQMLGEIGGGFLGTEEQRNRLVDAVLDKKTTYESLKPEDQEFLGQLYKGKTGQEAFKGMKGQFAENVSGSEDEVNKIKKGKPAGAVAEALDEFSTAASAQLAKAAVTATASIGTAATALNGFATSMNKLLSSDFEKLATTAAARAAGGDDTVAQETSRMLNSAASSFAASAAKLAEILEIADISGKNSKVSPETQAQVRRAGNLIPDRASTKNRFIDK
jgi:hypothetical protein